MAASGTSTPVAATPHARRRGRRSGQKSWTGTGSETTAKEAQLREAGWDVLVVWACETKEHEALTRRLGAFLG